MELWDEATALHLEKNYAEAEKRYDQLLTQNHTNPGLLATLGTLYLQTERIGLAITLLEASMKYGKERPGEVLCNLGVAYKSAGLVDLGVKCLEEAVRTDPTAQSLANYAGLFIEAGQPEKVISHCNRAIAMDPSVVMAHWNLALALLSEGRWETAWDEYEWGLKPGGLRQDRKLGDLPEWDGTPGKTVVVYGEQGLGDEIMLASMLPDLMKTNSVVLECHKRLLHLFEHSFPGLPCYGTREDDRVEWLGNHALDYRMSIGTLGKFFRRSRAAFPGTPYLKAAALPRGERFRVGISWTGGMKAGRIVKRSIPLSWWRSILDVPGVEFVSLQYTDCKAEIDIVNAAGYDIRVMDEYVKAEDYYETARLVKSCDLVISIATSVYHLAGAMGVPAWVMVPHHPPWREGNHGGMPFYRSVRLYRQPEDKADAWMPVVARVGFDLDELVSARQRMVA